MTDILIVSPTPTHPCNAGNRARISLLISTLRDHGYRVHFAVVPREPLSEDLMKEHWGAENVTVLPFREIPKKWSVQGIKKALLRRLGVYENVETLDGLFHKPTLTAFDQLFQKLKPSVVFVEYVFLSWLLKNVPASVHKVIDTHDIYTDRRERLQSTGIRYTYTLTREDEARGLLRADSVIAIQDEEAVFFQNLLQGERRILQIGHLLRPAAARPIPAAPVIGMLASSNSLNTLGLEQFLKEVLPLVRAKKPDTIFKLAGGACRHFGDRPELVTIGEVDDPAEFYNQCSVSVNNIPVGTGLKIKTIESLAHGCPAVCSPEGAAGLSDAIGQGVLIADNPEAFAQALLGLLDDPVLLEETSRKAFQYATDYYTRQADTLLSVCPQPQTVS